MKGWKFLTLFGYCFLAGLFVDIGKNSIAITLLMLLILHCFEELITVIRREKTK